MMHLILMMIIGLFGTAARAESIVVLGDSISAAYGMEIQQGWVALLQNRLLEQHSRYAISNKSISGDTTSGGLARLEPILQRHKPDILLVELGANDGLRGLSPLQMRNNLSTIVRRSQQAGAKVMLLAMRIPPNYGQRYIDTFYQVYPQLAKELDIGFVPFILEDVVLNPAMMQADGLHPNALAQPVIAEKIWTHLQPLLK